MPKQIDMELKSVVELVNQQMIFCLVIKKMIFRSLAVYAEPYDVIFVFVFYPDEKDETFNFFIRSETCLFFHAYFTWIKMYAPLWIIQAQVIDVCKNIKFT